MYLSDRDLEWAIKSGHLLVNPPPDKVDPTSLDLHLGNADLVRVWDVEKFSESSSVAGVLEAEVRLGDFDFGKFSDQYTKSPPAYRKGNVDDKVVRRHDSILVRPGGFVLWPTKEEVGTPEGNAHYICFVDGKSTRARTGILVHLTAPTIHAAWYGNITLEIANVGPLTFVLEEGDVIAQLTVAKVSSMPERSHKQAGSRTHRQTGVTGAKG